MPPLTYSDAASGLVVGQQIWAAGSADLSYTTSVVQIEN